MNKIERIKELVKILNLASKSYYQEDKEIMSNFEYDKLYDELVNLEKETDFVMSNSPTLNVGYEIITNLEKEKHKEKALSLNKTKDILELKDWLKDKCGLLSWKLDGLTIVLTYKNGELLKAVTRGNGEIGEVVTNNVKTFKNIPLKIKYKGELVIRGEAVIKYSDFEKINNEIPDIEAKYKNPRNLCSGSVRQLNNEITANRNIHIFIFGLVDIEDKNLNKSFEKNFEWLKEQGFEIVEYQKVNSQNIETVVKEFSEKIGKNDFPSDGLVLVYDDIEYGKSLGVTAKFPRDSIAFKWADETATTKLLDVEWSASRTGLINPIAIFEPVELEGTTVSRASLHNVSILKSLKLGINDEIIVYKSNMIIPQVEENLTKSDNLKIPEICPVCGEKTELKILNDVQTLYCINKECPAKKIKLFTHFVSRNAMNIDGLSEATLEKFIQHRFIYNLNDLFSLNKYKEQIIELDGFGKKSYENLQTSIEKSKYVQLPNFIFSLGISNIGLSNAKLICKYFNDDFNKIRNLSYEELVKIDGIGNVIAENFCNYFSDKKNNNLVDELLKNIKFERKEEKERNTILEGKTFVITGNLNEFSNRDELKNLLESKGAKVTNSVTKKTNYLINNDVNSNSSKNKKAKELGILIIDEKTLIKMF